MNSSSNQIVIFSQALGYVEKYLTFLSGIVAPIIYCALNPSFKSALTRTRRKFVKQWSTVCNHKQCIVLNWWDGKTGRRGGQIYRVELIKFSIGACITETTEYLTMHALVVNS